MKYPIDITLRDIEHSDAIEADIIEKSHKLSQFYNDIIGCRVLLEAPHQHHHKGRNYHARIEISVPGKELVVSRDPGTNEAHTDAYVAIRDAFDAARRQLQDFAQRQRGDVKAHNG